MEGIRKPDPIDDQTASGEADPEVASAADRPDASLAALSAAVLFAGVPLVLGAVALASGHSRPAAVVLAVGGASLATALVLAVLPRLRAVGLGAVFAADVWGVALIAVAIDAGGHYHSPYAQLYLLAVVHAAAFQPRARTAALTLLALLAYLVPAVAVDDVTSANAAGVVIPALTIILAAGVVYAAAARLRRQLDARGEREAEARRLADQDPLTGLGNYRLFWRAAEGEVARVRRHGGAFSLVLLDLDRFKAVNDDLGHRAGDDVLQRVAGALRATVRRRGRRLPARRRRVRRGCRAGRSGRGGAARRAARRRGRRGRPTGAPPRDRDGRLGDLRRPRGHRRGPRAARGRRDARGEARGRRPGAARAIGAPRAGDRAAPPPSRPLASTARRPRGSRSLAGLARALAAARDERTAAETAVAPPGGRRRCRGRGDRQVDRSTSSSSCWPSPARPRWALRPRSRPMRGSSARRSRASCRCWWATCATTSAMAACPRPPTSAASSRCRCSSAASLGRAVAPVRPRRRLRRGRRATRPGGGGPARPRADRRLGALAPGRGGASSSPTRSPPPCSSRVRSAGAWPTSRGSWRASWAWRGRRWSRSTWRHSSTTSAPSACPRACCSRPGDLNDQELALMREHPAIGERMLRAVPRLRERRGDRAPRARALRRRRISGRARGRRDPARLAAAARLRRLRRDDLRAHVPGAVAPAEAVAELRGVAGSQLDPASSRRCWSCSSATPASRRARTPSARPDGQLASSATSRSCVRRPSKSSAIGAICSVPTPASR